VPVFNTALFTATGGRQWPALPVLSCTCRHCIKRKHVADPLIAGLLLMFMQAQHISAALCASGLWNCLHWNACWLWAAYVLASTAAHLLHCSLTVCTSPAHLRSIATHSHNSCWDAAATFTCRNACKNSRWLGAAGCINCFQNLVIHRVLLT
jgi:hypothetical protein